MPPMLAVRNTVQIDAPIVRNATRCGFFMAGFRLSVWAPLVPYVRERIEMTDAVFGLLLLCIGVGSLTWMPLSAVLVSRWGVLPVQLCSVRSEEHTSALQSLMRTPYALF